MAAQLQEFRRDYGAIMKKKQKTSQQDLEERLQKREQDDYKTRIKQLESVIKQQEQQLDQLKSAKWDIPTARRPRSTKGNFCRVAIPDTHGSQADRPAIAALLKDLEILQPREIILLGDHLDCGGFLAQHWTLGFVAQTEETWEDDINAANSFLDATQKTVKQCEYHYLFGNHENRVEKWCVTQALKNQTDAKYLFSLTHPAKVLHLEKRNIAFYEQNTNYQGLTVRGTIKLGNCYFTHGVRTGVHATRRILMDFGGNIVHGHTHTSGMATDVSVSEGLISGWCPGCLCKLGPLWNMSAPTNWSHGYHLQIVRNDNAFLGINVPIIHGKSYLLDMKNAWR